MQDTIIEHLNFKEISAIVGLLVMFAGTVGVWIGMITRVKQLERDVVKITVVHKAFDDKFNKIFDLIQAQEREQLAALSEIQVTVVETATRLNDYIEWQRTHGGPNSGK